MKIKPFYLSKYKLDYQIIKFRFERIRISKAWKKCIWFNKIHIIYKNICKDLFLSTIIVSRFKFSSKEKDKNIISWKQDPTMSNNNFGTKLMNIEP